MHHQTFAFAIISLLLASPAFAQDKEKTAPDPGPGWADPRAPRVSKGSLWDDPRVGKDGPLPRDWTHYKGMYLHGDKVVLSYTVGDMNVLEMPDIVRDKGATMLTRSIILGPTK